MVGTTTLADHLQGLTLSSFQAVSSMFQGLAFYLAPTLSSEEKEELKRLISQNEGLVSDTPKGATQLVAYDTLDARSRNQISTDFIKDSVAFRALQDPAKYSGKIFTAEIKLHRTGKPGGRLQYTLEDDARMLHFARMRDWEAMASVKTWEIAEGVGVTSHSAESMKERFCQQLMMKTPVEQRILMTKAAVGFYVVSGATTRARLLEQEDEDEQEVQRQKSSPSARSRSTLTGFSTVEATERPRSTTTEAEEVEAPVKEVEGQKPSRRRTRSRKQTTPLQISQRIRSNDGDSSENITPPRPVSTSQPSSVTRAELVVPATATPTTPASQVVSARSDPGTGTQITEKQQKRKRDKLSSRIPSQESQTVKSDPDQGREVGGVYFTSAWATTVNDRSKRRLLQRFFACPSGVESSSSEQMDDTSVSAFEGGDNSENIIDPQQPEAQEATEEEADAILCQLQLDTHQDLESVLHALYYFSGDVEKAKRFLRRVSPPDIWCSEDDLLLTNLLTEDKTDLSSVGESLASGNFVSLQEPRDLAALLKRVNFLK
ncbi:hypothetical protein P3T76_002454 [Phytophthora citrophthora]|uniref:BRCT domain-containing protein n=1 Tax=Phytophthora citrophthora TaxID=4793 RepID=A0AAD9GWL0_9STRA|nr:hypothetical protein P3T76_002454 [Phytophthora citrophthora]